MFVVINFLTVMWYNPNLDTDCPSWVYASCALGLFLYQTFDAVDGMQAYVLFLLSVLGSRLIPRLGGERNRAGLWANSSITVCLGIT